MLRWVIKTGNGWECTDVWRGVERCRLGVEMCGNGWRCVGMFKDEWRCEDGEMYGDGMGLMEMVKVGRDVWSCVVGWG